MMLEVFNEKREKVAYLENAHQIVEDLKINSIHFLNFSLPKNDPKNAFTKMFHYVKTDNGLYRILKVTENEDTFEYEAEHVIATLLDNVIFGTVTYGNLGIYTEDVIKYVLNKQKIKNWVFDRCDFSRQFEYCWENENLAGALFSIPKPLQEDYIWVFNTEVYPWRLQLRKLPLDDTVFHITPKKNQITLKATSNPRDICTRIYPLGYGEGVNQLTIKSINNDIPYLQAEKQYIDKYGLQERVWVDRRYENVESLRDAAQVMLDKLKEPVQEYDLDFALFENDRIKIGDKVKFNGRSDTIIGIQYTYDDITQSKVTIANDTTSIAGTVADLADRQRIEMTYSQGATQLYAQSLQVNADARHGATINFYIPSEMRVVNKVLAKIKLEPFRAYSKATKGGGQYGDSTKAGDININAPSTEDGGYQTATLPVAAYINAYNCRDYKILPQDLNRGHNHGIEPNTYIQLYDGQGKPYERAQFLESGDHVHLLTLKNHKHSINLKIEPHKHEFKIPEHSHEIEAGIYEFGSPKHFEVKVNGKSKGYINETSWEYDVTDYLLDKKKRIPRGSWHSIEIVPNELAYITIDLFFQGFVQSRGDYTV